MIENGMVSGLTIESKVNNKRVLHNGMMGVYGDFTPVPEQTVNELHKKVKEIQKYILAKTDHTVTPQTYGVVVMSGVGNKEVGQAFVGYDEGVDSKVRLCYTTDTFLAMELSRHLDNFSFGVSTPVKEVVAVVEEVTTKISEVVETVKEVAINKSVVDYGWGTAGEKSVMTLMESKVDKVCKSYASQGLLDAKDIKVIRKQLLEVLTKHKESLTKASIFNTHSPLYVIIEELLEVVKMVIPNTTVYGGEYKVAWEIVNGETVLVVYDKNNVGADNAGTGNIAVSNDTPSYTILRKLFDLISSNIGYSKLRTKAMEYKGKDEGKKVTPSKPVAVKKVEKDNEVVKLVQPTEKKKTNNPTVNVLSNDYYDIYLAKSGKWGKTDGKYTSLKGIIGALIGEYDIDGVSLRGIDNTEVVIDWVINKKSHTMALTKKATRVIDLEVNYDMAIAYDTGYPELLEVLIKDKLNGVVESIESGELVGQG